MSSTQQQGDDHIGKEKWMSQPPERGANVSVIAEARDFSRRLPTVLETVRPISFLRVWVDGKQIKIASISHRFRWT
jgi:hypothetical protein